MQPQQFQPQQSPMQPMQQAPKQKKKLTLAGMLLIGMIISGVILLIALIAWIALGFKSSSDTGKTLAGAAAVIEPDSVAPSKQTIVSSLGVTIPYNTRELSGFGFSEDVTYSSNDLSQKRPYSVIRLRPVETSQASRNEITMMPPELRITSSLDKDYWGQFENKKEYSELSKLDILVEETTAQRSSDKWVTPSDVEVQKVGETEYRKISYKSKNEDFGVTSLKREDCYVTVQQDRPYVACINNIRSANFSTLSQLEAVLADMTYQKPDEDALLTEEAADEADKSMLDAKSDEEVTASDGKEQVEETEAENTPESSEQVPQEKAAKISPYLTETADFYSFAKAAPATVRVGSIYCADIKLTLPTGKEGPLLTGACVDRSGTGFFVSRDGLVATSAGVVKVKPQEAIRSYIVDAPNSAQMYERLDRVLSYMVEGRLLMQTDADAIVAGVQERNQDIVEKVNSLSAKIVPENITIAKESYSYAIQLQDKPIVVNETGNGALEFAYSDTVVTADIEGSQYTTDKTQEQIFNGETIGEDLALLKLKNNITYPALALASDTNLPKETPVNIIGMPSYTVGSLLSGQLRPTPLFRQGGAGEVFSGHNAQRLVFVSTASYPGFSGAPAINRSGEVVGVATFNNQNCPTGSCFMGTVIRDISEIRSVAKSRNVSLQPLSIVADTWDKALKELIKGNYTEANKLFNDSARLYPQNHLATPMANYAKSQIGSATDTSNFNVAISAAQIVALIAGLFLVLLMIARIMVKIFVRPKYETQYGAFAQGQYVDPRSWQPQQPSTSGGYAAPSSPSQQGAAPQQPWSAPQQSSQPSSASAYPPANPPQSQQGQPSPGEQLQQTPPPGGAQWQ